MFINSYKKPFCLCYKSLYCLYKVSLCSTVVIEYSIITNYKENKNKVSLFFVLISAIIFKQISTNLINSLLFLLTQHLELIYKLYLLFNQLNKYCCKAS